MSKRSADQPSHSCLAVEFLRGLHELQSTGDLCDVKLKSNEGESAVVISCHRNVLSVHSLYFRSLFKWKKGKDSSQPELLDFDGPTLNELVHYAYTLDMSLNDDNVADILVAAQFLQMDGAIGHCCNYYETHMRLSNCLTVHALATMYQNPSLAAAALATIHPHFLRWAQSQDFLRMEAQQLAALIASDEVEVNSEDEVLEAVLRWLDYDRPGRLLQVPTVLQSIRAPFLSAQSRLQYDLALESAAAGMVDELAGGIQNNNNTTQRHSVGAHEVMFCVNVYDADSKGTAVQVFDPSIPAVWDLKKLSLPADISSVVMLDGRWMMISSAIHGWKIVQRNRRFTGLVEEWGPPVAGMHTWRVSGAPAALDDRVYVAGGYDLKRSQLILSTMEVYDFPSNSWRTLADLPVPLTGLVMVAHDGLLYAFGGSIAIGNVSNLVHAYHPADNTWSRLADMPMARDSFAACVGPDGWIYVVGGRASDLGVCARVEAYNPVTNKWLRKGDLVHPRKDLACACLGGELYVLGGYVSGTENDPNHDSIEVYDAEADRWTLHECRLLAPNLGFACVKMKLKRA
ncbi:kelch-like protein 3 [Paramacrobiotus metropolitanus]|uniref:kelch-like protein 3 n=1 Tax=Paramacrobiotus metropolitanus TaxID=2943436 RepID=UPI002445869A|nr:kelch-like protein 3 [Paramacrobiotus metropolitanus]